MLPILLKDGYKASHREQYPAGTEFIYSNFTPRSNKYGKAKKVVVFGIQAFIQKYLIDEFNNEFFKRPKAEVLAEYKAEMDAYLGTDYKVDHIAELHDLGYLPLRIKALQEGSRVKMGIPVLTIINTNPKFFWLTNFLETLISAQLWLPMTSATTAYTYKEILTKYAKETGGSLEFIPFQGHDFSMRGMAGVEAAMMSGGAHLTSFVGTDTIPAIGWLKKYYKAEGLIGCSVNASEHSTMCAGSKESEFETYKRFITELYPSGIVSIVSDTWDFWKVITDYLPRLKSEIMARSGKLVIRGDSGDPADIICGTSLSPNRSTPEEKGLIECLWEIFGGTTNAQGYKTLDSHIGAIYGDGITLNRAEDILSRLKTKGFTSDNIVMGVGSFSYALVSRDTYGFAMKATWQQVNGVEVELFKDPTTDTDKLKKSAKGLLAVNKDDNGEFTLKDRCSIEEEREGFLKTVFFNGEFYYTQTLSQIRQRLQLPK